MTNLEHYKDELKKTIICYLAMGNSWSDDIGDGFKEFAYKHIIEWMSDDKKSSGSFIDWLLEEYKEKIELKQWEFDLLGSYNSSNRFYEASTLQNMSDKGHFKGVKDKTMMIKEILDNCIIVED